MDQEVLEEFIDQIIFRLDESSRMVALSLEKLDEDFIWKRPHHNANSIGNLILHLCGNITQYAISSLGETEDIRNRDLEFESKDGYSKKELLDKLEQTVQKAKKVIQNTTLDQYLMKRDVQGFTFSGIGIAIHVTEHYSYHTGQIAFWTKQITEKKSLGFYDGIDLNTKNKD